MHNEFCICHKAEASRDPVVIKCSLQRAEENFISSLEICKTLKSVVERKDFMEMRARLLLNLGEWVLTLGKGNPLLLLMLTGSICTLALYYKARKIMGTA